MWNSNSVIAWVIARSGIDAEPIRPPTGVERPAGRPDSRSRAGRCPRHEHTPARGARRRTPDPPQPQGLAARQGKAGAGMVHTIGWRVALPEAVDFWESRLAEEGIAGERYPDGSFAFRDPEGLRHALIPGESPDEPLIADHPEVPQELALQGFHGVRAYAHDPEQSRRFLEETLEFDPHGDTSWEVRGEQRGGLYLFDQSDEVGVPGAGTVHHVAWASPMDEHEAWQRRVAESGAHPTPVIDRFYFESIYFREPSGVLFEIATIGPASPPTSRWRPSASTSRCRRTTSTCATGSRAC